MHCFFFLSFQFLQILHTYYCRSIFVDVINSVPENRTTCINKYSCCSHWFLENALATTLGVAFFHREAFLEGKVFLQVEALVASKAID